MQLPIPRTRLQLRQFLNISAYFRTSIPAFSRYITLLYELVTESDPKRKNSIQLRLGQKHLEAFQGLREKIRTHLPLSNPNYERGFYLFIDACGKSLTFLLFQLDYNKISVQEENDLDFENISNIETLEKKPKIFILCGSRKVARHLK